MDREELLRALEPLSDREARVLAAIVQSHIDSPEPIGSKTLVEKSGLDVSPATIRNVMAQLHERGLIAKPHTSAGRVPTTAGFRYFVDSLLQLKEPPPQMRDEIAARLQDAGSVERALEEAGRVLSRLSQKACVVRAPRTEVARLKQIDFVRLRDDAVLVILVTAEGIVQNRLIELAPEGLVGAETPRLPDADELARVARYLTERAGGRTLDEVRTLLEAEKKAAEDELDDLKRAAVRLGQAALDGDRGSAPPPGVVVEGERHLLDPSDPKSLERMKELLSVLEEKDRLVGLLDAAADAPGIRVFIGEENPLRELAEMSVITASYGDGVRVFGTLGVIGPTRMDYARVVPLVELTARMVSRLLS